MTNEEFAEWRKRHFRSVAAAAKYLGLCGETLTELETGKRRRGGKECPIKPHIELCCAAVDAGLATIPPEYRPGHIGATHGKRAPHQTAAILSLADGTRSPTEIAQMLNVRRSAVYAAIRSAKLRTGQL